MHMIFVLVFAAAGAFADCGEHFSPGLHSALRTAEALSPELAGAQSSEELFLRLLEPNAPGPDLRSSQRDHYNVENMTDAELAQFYDNAIRGLRARVAQLWRQEEVEKIVGKLSPRVEGVATHLLDTFFSPVGLNEGLSPDEAEDYFGKRPWITFPWATAVQAIEGYSGEAYRFHSDKLSNEDNRRVQLALMTSGRLGDCCLTEPGCTRCPHNRASLRR